MTIRRDRVAVAGDWHGNTKFAVHVIDRAAAAGCDVLLHLGDFGIWPGAAGRRYLDTVTAAAAENRVTLLVTPGNHEDYDTIDALRAEDRGGGWGAVHWWNDSLALFPRGHRFTIVGSGGRPRTFVSLGGAPSIDLFHRVPGRSWWPQEVITANDVARVVDGGPADYLLAHDTPEPAVPAVEKILQENPGGWPDDALKYCRVGRDRLTEAFLAVRPQVLLHGHYHVRDTAEVTAGPPGETFTCRIESLGTDGVAGNAVVLDVSSGKAAELV